MSKRVVLGNLGSSLYGLRVSKTGSDAINTDGSAVDVTNLLFDSVNPIGHLPIYKIYDVTVAAATAISGSSGKVVTPTSKTVNFGETLSYPPLVEAYHISGTNDYTSGYKIKNAYPNSLYNYSRTTCPTDAGYFVTSYDDSFVVSNYYQSQQTFRVFLMQPPASAATGADTSVDTVNWSDISVSNTATGVGETNSQTITGISTNVTLRVSTGGTTVSQIEAYNGTTQLATASNASTLDVTVGLNTPVKWRFTNPGVNSSFTATVTNQTDGGAFVDSYGVSITSAPTYSLSGPSIIYEGTTGTYTVNTTSIANGTLIYWQIVSGTTADFVSTSGSFQISSGSGTFYVSPKEDNTLEGDESYTVQIATSSGFGGSVKDSQTVTIKDNAPSYTLAGADSITESNSATYTVSTNNVANGTTLYWTINSTTADFNAVSGSFTISSNSGSFSITAKEDATIEGTENFTLSVRTGSTSGTVVASKTFSVTDQPSSYSISGPGSINEGGSGTFTVGTNNVANGTTLYWTLNGTTSDFSAIIGAFTVNSNSGSFSISPLADTTTEGAESYTVSVRVGGYTGTVVTSAVFTVNDTSLTPESGSLSPATASFTEGSGNVAFTATIFNRQSSTFNWQITRNPNSGSVGGGEFSTATSGTFTSTSYNISVGITNDSTSEINYQGESFTITLRAGSTVGAGTSLASSTFTVYDDDTTVSATNLTIPNSSTAHTASITVSYTATGSAAGRIKNSNGVVLVNFTASSGTNSVFVNNAPASGGTATYYIELYNGIAWLSAGSYTVTRLGLPSYSLSDLTSFVEGGSGTYTFSKTNELQTVFYWRIEANPNNPSTDFATSNITGTVTLPSGSSGSNTFTLNATDSDSINTNTRQYYSRVYKNSNYTTLLASDQFQVSDNDSGGGGGGSGPGDCFIAGSQVLMADRTYKPIEEVQVGDKVIGLEEMVNEVIDLRIHEEEQRILCDFGNQHTFVTDTHPFLDSEGYWTAVNLSVAQEKYPNLQLRELIPGATLMKYNPDLKAYVPYEVPYINQSPQTVKVYNLNVSGEDTPGIPGNDTYIVDGYIVHNK